MASYLFRVDASQQIGTGHVMRCLALANALRELGGACHFVCRAHPGHLGALIRRSGHNLTLLSAPDSGWSPGRDALAHATWLGVTQEQDAEETGEAIGAVCWDWMIVDHYALDVRWETSLRRAAVRIMVIDDLADRVHDCDVLLDQNLGRDERAYASLVPPNTVSLIGPSHALLRPEFLASRSESLERRKNSKLQHLLVSMGGIDARNATGAVLAALQNTELPADSRITVVMGAGAPHLAVIVEQAKKSRCPCDIRVDATDMAQMMSNSDLAIGAAGSTSWERCCLGVPSIVVALSENQVFTCMELERAGAAISIDSADKILHQLPHLIGLFLNDPKALESYSSAAARICDGNGARIVVAKMDELRGAP